MKRHPNIIKREINSLKTKIKSLTKKKNNIIFPENTPISLSEERKVKEELVRYNNNILNLEKEIDTLYRELLGDWIPRSMIDQEDYKPVSPRVEKDSSGNG